MLESGVGAMLRSSAIHRPSSSSSSSAIRTPPWTAFSSRDSQFSTLCVSLHWFCVSFRSLLLISSSLQISSASMGFLHKLWDETLAGPTPDTGLGKLRKYNSFSPLRSPPLLPDQPPVSRTITLRRTSTDAASVPDSPAALSAPGTPVTPGTPRCDFRRFTRRRWETDDRQSPPETPESTSPTVFDWIIITGLDR